MALTREVRHKRVQKSLYFMLATPRLSAPYFTIPHLPFQDYAHAYPRSRALQ